MAERPVVVMVSGPNGAGKSSIAPGLLARALGVVEYVNADVIARGLSGFDPDRAAVAAGKVMLQHMRELVAEKVSFAFETTGASRTFAAWLEKMIIEGYRYTLAHVWVESADISVARVANRVILGGHNVPEETIRRRYMRGLSNFFELYMPLAHDWQFWNNSAKGNGILVAEGGRSKALRIYGVETWELVKQMAAGATER